MKQRSDGRYAVKYKDRTFYGKTQKEAKAKLNQYKIDEATGQLLNGRQTFRAYAASWLPIYKKDVADKQYDQYVGMLNSAADKLGDPWLDTITPTMIKDLYNQIDDMSKSYISKYVSLVRSVMRSAYRDGLIRRDPTIDIKAPQGTEGTHRALEDWEDDLVLRLQDHRLGPAVMTMRYAGLRRGEACYLEIDRDVDFERHLIHVRGGLAWDASNQPSITQGKTDAAIRTIPLLDPLERCLYGRHGLLISQLDGTLMTKASWGRAWDSWVACFEEQVNGLKHGWWERERMKALEAGTADLMGEWVPCTIRSHDFRHSYCSDLYAAGVDIKTAMKWMGHADAKMILEIYAHLRQETEDTAAENLAKLVADRTRPRLVKQA